MQAGGGIRAACLKEQLEDGRRRGRRRGMRRSARPQRATDDGGRHVTSSGRQRWQAGPACGAG
eukprot:1264032-Pyramimonas_sp.AAC.1